MISDNGTFDLMPPSPSMGRRQRGNSAKLHHYYDDDYRNDPKWRKKARRLIRRTNKVTASQVETFTERWPANRCGVCGEYDDPACRLGC